MTRILLPVLLVCCLAGAATARADQAAPPASAAPANPYSATVPVAGPSDTQRDAAISAALAQVLKQLAPNLVATPDLLAQAPGLARNFRYQRAPAGNGLELEVEFDPGSVNRLIQQTGASTAATGGPASPSSSAPAPAGQGGTGTLWVDGIDSGHTFTSLLALLRGTPQLHDVTPEAAKGEGVLLHVAFDAPLKNILATLTGPGGHLAPAATAHPGADASLRWVP